MLTVQLPHLLHLMHAICHGCMDYSADQYMTVCIVIDSDSLHGQAYVPKLLADTSLLWFIASLAYMQQSTSVVP